MHQFEKCQAELVEAGVELRITRLRQAQADNNFIETFQTDALPKIKIKKPIRKNIFLLYSCLVL